MNWACGFTVSFLNVPYDNRCICLYVYVYTADNLSYLDERIDTLTEKCISELQTQGFKR